jgi:raffinose/stachyose/melibiose transport system substrate-binding protein
MFRKFLTLISILLIATFILTACGTPATEEPTEPPAGEEPQEEEPQEVEPQEEEPQEEEPQEEVVIEWWHISTKDPALSDWQKMADDFMAMHENVTINITVLENEAFKTKLNTDLQSGQVPDIFQSWGGSGLAEQAEAGLLLDITEYLDADDGSWRNSFAPGALAVFSVDGKNYGVPWDMGMVSCWYNKDLFEQAGIEAPPETWEDFLADVQILKDAGITPIALGEKDTWTGMHIWSYLVTRIGGEEAFNAAAYGSGSFADPAFVQAGEELMRLIEMEPFQPGFLGANHDEMQATFGNGEAAILIGGQWSPSVQAANSADGEGVANLGMFNFPAVEGGAGAVTDAMGGGNGFAVGKDAEPEAIEFVKYLTNVENQTIIAADGIGIPVVDGAEVGLTDPNMLLVQQGFAAAEYFQLYYDQILPPVLAGTINDATAKLYAQTATPEEVAQEIANVAAEQ